ncbi:MAG: discoidin domain-containing protein [Armatimonadota bacterium]|nr:discoidin domain-containing protein [Armatimonadota bacterium]MCX7776605.1 discoidin domain-containing protein [Armatimonadota bacterium]MDW8025252.1 discoidin domain-containing protein [Armatimonadota bacterium]
MIWLCLLLLTSSQRPNIALNRPYQLQPMPNYRHCTDPDDRIQLTDGQYVRGYFWTQRGTVGWQNVSPVIITVDLGSNMPIAGVSFNTAAGVAGVQFPNAIWVLVSADGKQWFEVGDLVQASNAQNGPPPSQGYAVHRFWTDRWKACGRFISLIVIPQGPFCFADEIEVYKGDDVWLTQPLKGKPHGDLKEFAQRKEIERCALRRLRADLEELRRIIEHADVALDARDKLMRRLNELASSMPRSFEVDEPSLFSATLPLNEWHRELFKLQAQLWQALRITNFTAFVAHSPYDPLPYLTPEPLPKERILSARLTMLQDEVRHIAINLVNADERPIKVRVKADGFPIATAQIRHAVWTDTKEGVPIAAALPEGDEFVAAAGMIGQVWVTFLATKVGKAKGRIALVTDADDQIEIGIQLSVLPISMPRRQSLHLGGWDYTDVEQRYGVNPLNRDEFIKHIRERFVDIPWASRFVMPSGKFDEAGRMIEPPDTSNFDRWLERWKGASRYYVFLSVEGSFGGAKVGTDKFANSVGEWISFWWGHAQKRGLKKGQFGVLLVDEPHTPEQDELTIAWAEAIKRAAPEVVIWVDPTWREPEKMNQRLPEVVDVLCPNRIIWLSNPKAHDSFYIAWRNKGKRLALYSCSGPSKLLDPYSYYRLQAWHCFAIGADEMFFWAFGDNAGNSCWNAYLDPRNCYTPLFLAPKSVTAAKHMEAIRDGVQDYEILKMLSEAATQFRRGKKAAIAAEAEKLLTDGLKSMLAPIGANEIYWMREKDRTGADKIRERAIELLLKLTGRN